MSTAKRRILVVDDNTDAANSFALMLKMLGNEVRTAHDGLQAIQTAESFLPQVVLMDLGMPKLNGLEAARQIRQHPWSNGMTLVAISGWPQDDARIRALEAGFDHHLTKPVDADQLAQALAADPKGS